MDLLDYQKEALLYSIKTKNSALLMDMRLGKSVIFLYRARLLSGKKLIVCPISAFDGWIKLIEKIYGIKPVVLYGTRKDRLKDLARNSEFSIINWDGYRVIPEIRNESWSVICLDESHLIKNPKSQVTKFFLKYFRRITYKCILTGTPMEDPLDLITQFNFIGITNINYYIFRNQYCYISEFMKFKPNSTGDREISKWLSKCFIRTKKDVNFSCEKIYDKRVFKFSPKIRAVYDQLEYEFLIRYNGVIELKSLFAIQKLVWLRLLTSGLLNDKLVWRDKLDGLVELINTNNEQTIIWCTYRPEFALLKKSFPSALGLNGDTKVEDRIAIMNAFNTKKKQILIAQPECFKHGGDASAASRMIYFSQPNSLTTRKQTEDRAVHLLKTSPVMIYDFIVENTIDGDILDSFKEKNQELTRLSELSKQYNHN